MIICEVYYSVEKGKRPELMKLADANVRASRKEQGNIAYTHYPSMENETDMFVFEIWESAEDLERHIHADHYLEFSCLRKPMLTDYRFLNYEANKVAEGDSIPTWT